MKQKLLIGLAVALIAALGIASWSVIQVRNAVEANTREIQRQAQEAEARRQAALAHNRAEAQARQDDLKRAAERMARIIGGVSPTPTAPPEKPKER
jgi:hypothetical protein